MLRQNYYRGVLIPVTHQAKQLGFPWITLAESLFFNGLQRIQIKNIFLALDFAQTKCKTPHAPDVGFVDSAKIT
jgi:hypothetical protein